MLFFDRVMDSNVLTKLQPGVDESSDRDTSWALACRRSFVQHVPSVAEMVVLYTDVSCELLNGKG